MLQVLRNAAICGGLFLLASTGFAQESTLKIIDATGLTRAVKVLRSKATVEIRLSPKVKDEIIHLTPVNQSVEPLSAERQGTTVVFQKVIPGVWSVDLSSERLLKVKIR